MGVGCVADGLGCGSPAVTPSSVGVGAALGGGRGETSVAAAGRGSRGARDATGSQRDREDDRQREAAG